jgi:putative transposase
MPQRGPELCAGEYYHFYNRGHNRGRIFFERDNYLFFLRRVGDYLFPVLDIVAYCLMPTHYHVLASPRQTSDVFKTSEVSAGVSRAMQRLGVSYTKAINKRYHRVGALFQGAYRYKHIGKNEYLVHLSCYVHLNPVIEGLAQRAEDWEFSSYRDYVGLGNGSLAAPGVVLHQFRSAEDYREFTESYMPGDRARISDFV